jgi:signal-transduction protein with cAMP-binding, CBS, and nucleotidyltransferase domain
MKLDPLTATHLMTADIFTAMPSDTLRSAAQSMTAARVHALVVPGMNGRAPGIITCKDLVNVIAGGESDALDLLRVSDAMTSPAITVQCTMAVLDCVDLMRLTGVRSVPVLEGSTVVGILSLTDVLRAAAA